MESPLFWCRCGHSTHLYSEHVAHIVDCRKVYIDSSIDEHLHTQRSLVEISKQPALTCRERRLLVEIRDLKYTDTEGLTFPMAGVLLRDWINKKLGGE